MNTPPLLNETEQESVWTGGTEQGILCKWPKQPNILVVNVEFLFSLWLSLIIL